MKSPAFTPRISMEFVARQAGVSAATVSRALRNDPRITPETRGRVQAIARKLNYRPDPLISALVSRRVGAGKGVDMGTIAWLISHPTREAAFAYRFYRGVHEGAKERAEQLGYKLEDFWLGEPGMSAKRMSDILHARGIRGICVGSAPGILGPLDFPWSDFACVATGYSMTRPMLHRTGPHQYNNTRLALRETQSLGYRRIGVYIESVTNDKDEDNWLAAVLAHRFHYPEVELELTMVPQLEPVSFEKWFRRVRPDVVITQADHVISWLGAMGRRVPADVGVVALNWTKELGARTGINQNVAEIGATAVDLIISQMHRNAWGVPEHPHIVLIEGGWRRGKTVKKTHTRPAHPVKSADNPRTPATRF